MAPKSFNEILMSRLDTIDLSLNDIKVEQGKSSVRYEYTEKQQVKSSERHDKQEKLSAKNAPVIAFAAKLQSNMSKITIGFIITILGSYGINLSNEPAAPKPSNKEASNDSN